MPLVAAVDCGTSSTRAALFRLDGTLVGSCGLASPPAPKGQASAKACFEACLSDLARVLQMSPGPLGGIGVTAQLGLVLVDKALNPTTELLLWSEQAAEQEAHEIEAAVPDVAQLTGRPPSGETPAAKLRRLAKERPEVLLESRWALSLKDYLVAKLSGEVATDEATASYSLLFDISQRSWSLRLAEAARIQPHLLPRPVPCFSLAGNLRSDIGGELGLPGQVGIAVGGPDGSIGALGAGAHNPGVVVDVAGSTDVVLTTVEEPRPEAAAELLVNAFVLPGLWTLGGTTPTTGLAFDWLASLVGAASAGELLDKWWKTAMEAPVGCRGLSFDPAFGAPRIPRGRSAKGALVGIKPDHGLAELVRAVAEGGAFSVLEVLELLEYHGQVASRLRMVGGAARRWLAQLRADAWGREIELMAHREASLLGAALAASVASGLFSSVEEAASAMIRSEEVIKPRRELATAFADAYHSWQEMKTSLGARPFPRRVKSSPHSTEGTTKEKACSST